MAANPTRLIDPLGLIWGLGSNSPTGLYDPQLARRHLEDIYGTGNVESTTVPRPNDKNVKLSGKQHPETDVVFDNRGYPIFDAIAIYDTRLPDAEFDNASYRAQTQKASQDLKDAIKRGEIDESLFTPEELEKINIGTYKIPNYVWHHHQQWGRMQLVPAERHSKTGHIGGEGIHNGK